MDIYVSVANQKLRIATNLKNLVAGTQEFIRFIFELTDDWQNLHPFVQFQQDGRAYNYYLDDENAAYLPPTITAGTCQMMLYGSDGTVKGTTNCISLTIDENMLIGNSESIDIPPSLYDQLIEKVDNVLKTDTIQETIRENMRTEVQSYFSEHGIGALTIEDGSIEYRQLNADLQNRIDKPSATQIAQSLPDSGQSGIIYLVPTGSGKYDKYVWIDDNEPHWSKFDSSSAVVSDNLPAEGDSDVDYYIPASGGGYTHYRWINGEYVSVGSDSYTKDYIDNQIQDVNDDINLLQADYLLRIEELTSDIENKHNAVLSNVDDLAAQINSSQNEIDEIKGIIDDADATDTLNQLSDLINKNTDDIDQLKYESALYDAKLNDVDNMFDDHETKILDLSYSLDDVSDSVIELQSTIGDDFENMVQNVENNTSAITTIKSTLATQGGNISQNTSNINTLSSSINTLNTKIDDLDIVGNTYTQELDYDQENSKYLLKLQETNKEGTHVVSTIQLPQTGGGGGSSSSTVITIEPITPFYTVIISTDSAIVRFNYFSVNPDQQDSYYSGTCNWLLNNQPIISNVTLSTGENEFDLTEYCKVGENYFTLRVTDSEGSQTSRRYTIKKIDMRLESSTSDEYIIPIGQPVSFSYTPYGDVSKTIHFEFDGVEETIETTYSGSPMGYNIAPQPHGSHLLKVWATAIINNNEVRTPTIYKDFVWLDQSMDQSGHYQPPVIGCIYREDLYGTVNVNQYDILTITYNVFDPSTVSPIVERYIDDVLVSTHIHETSKNTWDFASATIGEHHLKLKCRDTVVEILVNVQELEDVEISPVTAGLQIDFNPVGITNDSSNRIWSNDYYHMSVNNFDWSNGGYKTDENGDPYFLVKAGSEVYFDYRMFRGDRDNNITQTGAELKIVFKTENVQNTDAVWFSNVDTQNIGGKTEQIGIQLGAHEGWLKTNTASNVTVGEGDNQVQSSNTYLFLPYSEEDVIELDININKAIDGSGFIMGYEDGVPAKAFIYGTMDHLYQGTTYTNPNTGEVSEVAKPIKIGSPYCDVRIYRLKVYSTQLDTESIMKNFIADSRNTMTMIERYNHNAIYYNSEKNIYSPYKTKGTLDPVQLAQKIPDVKVLMLSAPQFTDSKDTFVKSTLRCVQASGGKKYKADPYRDNWLYENGYHAGQGTTSNYYGISGRNVDFLFNCDGKNKPSNKVDVEPDYVTKLTRGYGAVNQNDYIIEYCGNWEGENWQDDTCKVQLTEDSVPNNFFNFKVNIASSENVNNALLQRMYSDFLPYTSLGKLRDNRVKNDMEFVPAVLFIQETDDDLSTHREFQDKEWHFYALGNLGDSKKTDYTRAYDPTDVNEFTIEISDNTPNNAQFQTGVYENEQHELAYVPFTIRKTWNDKKNKLVVETVPSVNVTQYVYPIPKDRLDELLYAKGTITVDNQTGKPEYDGDESGYLNLAYWSLYNEDFDGDHSFEPRYACCGDYRDGKLVNDLGHGGKNQVKKNNDVWRAFYKWVITSTDEEFVDELDQWCNRDAVEYFYAFTHYFTMMDNRAKNTFWHFARTGTYREVTKPVKELLHVYHELVDGEYEKTTDTEIDDSKTYYTEYAFDLWDYDNDTALGINNSGELIFPYGKEDTDYNIDGDPTSNYIFNGAASVFWCRLRDLCGGEISNMYSKVNANCFSANYLINEFDTFQQFYPEEIWRLDIERKYIRIYYGTSYDNSVPKSDSSYLRAMMQGRKKYQRRQWIRNQEVYFSTRDQFGDAFNQTIEFRFYKPQDTNLAVEPSYVLRVVPYQDMYVSAKLGNTGGIKQIRAKAGVECVLDFPPPSNASDTQTTFYAAHRLQALNDLSACYVSFLSIEKAKKLRKLVVGNRTDGFVNNRLSNISTVEKLGMLEELDISNIVSIGGALDFRACPNLTNLYADGTNITGVQFATNGKLQTAYLPNTIMTLVMRNLNELIDFRFSMDYLAYLTLQGGRLDNQAIILDTIDTLRELSLYDIDWTGSKALPNTELLNTIYTLQYSNLTGTIYIDGQIRQKELENYSKKWSDLEVTYNPENLVTQYIATFKNYDGTFICSQYVDQGSQPYDPIEAGEIAIPTRSQDQEYTYTFSNWDNITTPMLSNRDIIAQYSTEIRTYTIRWFERVGIILKSVTAQYGDELVYDGPIPKRTDEESSATYNIFAGWNKSTGFIREDLDVYAIWDRASLPLPHTVELKDMSIPQIYAIAAAKRASEYFDDKDYIDINVGQDYNFQNISSRVLANEEYFDGNRVMDFNDIRLFGADSDNFTLAIDYEFTDSTNDSTLVSCYEEIGQEGFRLRYSNSPNVQWGDRDVLVSSSYTRNIIVIRHLKGDNKLYVYSFNPYTGDLRYSDSIGTYELNRSRSTNAESILTFGAVRFLADGGYDFYAKGWIHWSKIWFDDLGDDNCKNLVNWVHETWRMEYYGANKYRLAGTGSARCNASFICNHELSLGCTMIPIDSGDTSNGWAGSSLRQFANTRIFNAYPIGWRSILQKVRINSVISDGSSLSTSEDYVIIPGYGEVVTNSSPYSSEGSMISFFTNTSGKLDPKIKFRGIITPETDPIYENNDPTAMSRYTVTEGTLWYNGNNGYAGYIYISADTYSKHRYLGVDLQSGEHIRANNGGLWIKAQPWWERTLYPGYDTYYYMVDEYGNGSQIRHMNNTNGVVHCISI